MTKGHGGFSHGRSHGIGHSSFGHHSIGNSSFGNHHHHHHKSTFGHRSIGNSSFARHDPNYRGTGRGRTTLLTDQNWENKEPAANGKWQGEFCAGCCYSPNDCVCACYFPCCYNCMLANDIGRNQSGWVFLNTFKKREIFFLMFNM